MTARLVDVRRTRLAVREEGTGPTFVWGHGLLSSMDQEDAAGVFDWSPVTATHRLVRYDARGHGDSRGSRPGTQTWPELAEDLLGLLDALGIERTAAGGASMGAGTLLHAAVRAPERFSKLVLVIPPTAWSGRRVQAAVYRGMSLAARTGAFHLAGPVVRRLPRRRAAPGTRGAAAAVALDAMFDSPGRLHEPLAGAARTDLPSADAIRGIGVPTLILAWTQDPTHPVGTAKRLHELIAPSTLRVAASDDDVAAWPAAVAAFLDDPGQLPGAKAPSV